MKIRKTAFDGIEGGFTFPRLYSDMVGHFPSGSVFVEVGVYKGRSLYYLLLKIKESGKNIFVYGVDHYRGDSEGMYDETLNNLYKFEGRFNLIRERSIKSSKKFKNKSIDFVFIDAGHHYKDIKSDILSWKPKVKDNGIMAGHDYVIGYYEVIKAVDEIFGSEVNLDYVNEGCWLVKFNKNVSN